MVIFLQCAVFKPTHKVYVKKIQWTNNIIAANLWLMFSFWFTIWVGPIFAWTICSSTLYRRYIISPIVNIDIEEKNKTDIKYTFFLKIKNQVNIPYSDILWTLNHRHLMFYFLLFSWRFFINYTRLFLILHCVYVFLDFYFCKKSVSVCNKLKIEKTDRDPQNNFLSWKLYEELSVL